MNLNDTNHYFVVIFKRSLYYTPKESSMMLRDVFMRFTKDGVRPNLGIQEIFLLNLDNYEKLLDKGNIFKREEVRQLASHSFTVKGYINHGK